MSKHPGTAIYDKQVETRGEEMAGDRGRASGERERSSLAWLGIGVREQHNRLAVCHTSADWSFFVAVGGGRSPRDGVEARGVIIGVTFGERVSMCCAWGKRERECFSF